MIETYEKRGAAVRVERCGRSSSTIVTREHGFASRERGLFRAESRGDKPLALAPDVAGAVEVARRIASIDSSAVAIERMTVTAGVAEHSVSPGGAVASWSEEVARVHVSLVNRAKALRVAIDLGAQRAATLPLDLVFEIAVALETAGAPPARLDGPVELAGSVSAALWLFAASHRPLLDGSRLQLLQGTHPSWPIDGCGSRVEPLPIGAAGPPLLFRPSYRAAPTPAWFHVRASLRGGSRFRRRASFRAVALLTPFRMGRASVSAGVLAVGRGGSFAASLELPRERFADAILRIARRETWFPLEAGAWGSDTLVERALLVPAKS